MKLSERLKDRLIAIMEAGRLMDATERLPRLLEQGRRGLEELKEVIQLEADNAALHKQAERLRATLEEALPECWDTPKAERIIREAITTHNDQAT